MLSQISRPFRDSARLGLVPKGSVHSSWLSECNLTGRKETARSRTVCFVSLCVHRLDLPSDCITINHAKSAGKSAVDFEEECSCLDHFGVHRSLTYPPPSPLPLPPSTYFCDTKSPSCKKRARSYCRFESVSHTMRDVKIARPIQIYTYAHGAGGREWGWCVCWIHNTEPVRREIDWVLIPNYHAVNQARRNTIALSPSLWLTDELSQ